MYTFRITTYKNGKLADMTDNAYGYPTKKEAIEAAQYAADYWHHFTKNGEIQNTPSGAIRWFTDSEGNRCRREYKVVNNQ